MNIETLQSKADQKNTQIFLMNCLAEFGCVDDITKEPDFPHFVRVFQNSGGNFWILKNENSEILGTIAIQKIGNYAYLKRFYIQKEMRRKGLGKQLFDTAVNFCHETEITRVVLAVPDLKWEAANHFYQKMGFNQITELPKECDPLRNTIFYEKKL